MNSTVKNSLAVISGLILGGVVNMGIIMVSGSIISPPKGADVTTMEGLKESMYLMQSIHFAFPFLAHALGTFIGAFLTALIAVSHNFKLALIIGGFFLIGGITNAFLLPAPTWFIVFDIAVAYIPMAWLGWKMTVRNGNRSFNV